ncbi:MAG: PAS domain-containing protein [Nitrospinae bacterium]|nr:PAS domain-containing protein [Nitrospinota bacterium]
MDDTFGADLWRVQKELEAEIQRSEAILSCMKEGILAIDGAGEVLKLNRKARQMLNITGAKVEGAPISFVCGQGELLAFVAEGLAARDNSEREIKLSGPSPIIAMATRSPMFGSGGEYIGMVVALNDITQLRRLENVRRDFASNVSHELRTPITSIRGFVETLLNGAITEPDAARRFLEIINRHASRLSSIIEDLLTLSSLEKGEAIELARQPMLTIVQKAMDGMAEKAEEKHIKMKILCEQGIDVLVNGPLLETAISNLIDNAINYSEEGTTVSVSAERAGEMVSIHVRDEGPGIEKQHLDRIFERFYRVDAARSRKAGGTGLGLSIVKHVVLAHRGNVTVESVPGKGSVFSIHIPIGESQEGE